ncbi:MAG TPA: T9SS type A sorting domain-containing protein [Ignavibacteriaceae bacterium]|nr:T9SS type A sorting domain-containing protein [Ignavibacteriaceae bacterium]
MKTLICWFLLFSIQLFSQSYLNVLFNDGSYKNSPIGSLKKITLSTNGQQINFHLADGTTASENLADIKKMTLDSTLQGEPLPVELSSFTAVVNGNSIILMWRTETEVSNYGFEVERASSSNMPVQEGWKKIGFVQGYGNSNSPKHYAFTDTPLEGTSFQYRLKQIDTDGKFQYSDIVSVDIAAPVQFELKQNFPNPFNPATHITYNLPRDGFVTIKVYDIVGSEIAALVNEEKKAGSYLVTFDGVNLSSGVYICTMSGSNFIKSIKMLMIK